MTEDTSTAKTPRDEGPHWRAHTLTELVEYILATHHVFTRAELERATELAATVARAHPETRAAIRTFEELRDELIPHMEREEAVLFPYVRALDGASAPRSHFPTVAMPVRMMNMQHETVASLLAALRAQTRDYALPPDATDAWRALWGSLQALEADVDLHVHLESDVLFPRAIAAEAACRRG